MCFQRIRDLREDADLKQATVANYLNVAQGTYSEYESGKINIPIEALMKLAELYHVSLDYLTGRSDRR